jgi:hypothetical protein
MKAWVLALLAVRLVGGCDAGEVIAPQRPAPVPIPVPVIADAGPKALIGTDPATLGPAFDGLALGQAIDQQAATAWLKERGIEASAHVRDGRLSSINVRIDGSLRWRPGIGADFEEHWFAPALHQHATELVTEQGTFLQFDLEVPIERWIDTTAGSIVPLELVAKSLEDADTMVHLPTHSNYVDGRAHVTWIDSALAGAATATEISVREFHTYQGDRDVLQSHELVVELDAAPAVYAAIEHRLTELFGKPERTAKAVGWKRRKLTLSHTVAGSGVEHIELIAAR